MKFAKFLEENCIPEWKAAYFDYKKGKKLIKRVETELNDSVQSRKRQRNGSPSSTPLVRRSGSRARSGYGATTRDLQDTRSARPNSASSPEDHSDLESQTPTVLAPAAVSPWSPRSANHGLLQRVTTWTGANGSPARSERDTIELMPGDEAQQTFYRFVEQQIQKIDEFYKEREEEAGKRLGELRYQLQEMKDRKRVLASRGRVVPPDHSARADYTRSLVANVKSFFNYADIDLLNNHPINDDPKAESSTQMLLTYRVARRRLRIAIQEFYHSLELLQSYRSLNKTALTKVMKKFDKTAKVRSSPKYLHDFQDNTFVGTSNFLDKIMHDSEDVYAKYYYDGDRKHAVTALRTKARTEDNRFTMLRIGIYTGLAVALGIEGLVKSQLAPNDSTLTTFILQVWAALFFMILMVILFGVNCYIWTRNKINYVFIFEYNVRHNLSWIELLELPVFAGFVFCLLFWMCFSRFFPGFTTWYPLVFVCLTAVGLALPVRLFHLSTRRWLLVAHARLLVSGLSSVRFQDVFLGDMYNSLTYSMGNIALFFCLYRYNWQDPTQCGSSRSKLLGFFTTLPGIFRLLQCFRRYYDTKHAFPHLLNAFKYTMTIMQYTTLSLWRIHGSVRFKILYIVFAALNTMFTATWDIVMDVSLLQPGAKPILLRTHRAYKQTWVYYVFLISDPILRFSWIFYIIYSHKTQHAATLSFYIALVECLRRTMWSSFRVENEHVANVQMYRASRELPLPYAVHSSADLESQKRRSGDTTRVKNEQPRVAEAHATDFERKNIDGLHMDDVDWDDNSDAEPPSGVNSPAGSDSEGTAIA